MKKIVVIVVVGLAISSQAFSQTIPARVVLIDKESNFYMDANEVTVGDYLAFMNAIKEIDGENSAIYKEIIPNDAMCQQAYRTANYFTDPAFLNYPMVGVTYEQARVYCGWRTDQLNGPKKKPTHIYICSLPTDVELQKAAALQTEKPATRSISAVNMKTKGITDLGYNVKEITANKKVLVEEGANGLRFENYTEEASPMLGFRCKLIIKPIR